MNLWQALRRSDPVISMADWVSMFTFQGLGYPILNQTLNQTEEHIDSSFQGYVNGIFKTNPVVYACMAVRLRLFSEARFQFQRMRNGQPGEMFGTPALRILEEPWPNGTTGDLLAHAMQDADLAGNFYCVRRNRQLVRMRPDWVTIVRGSRDSDDPDDLDAELLGYIYHPGGINSGKPPVSLLPEQVAHFAPNPDPTARYRGMSWLTPLLREITSDSASTSHKEAYFTHGATPNMVVSFDTSISPEAFNNWVDMIEKNHAGAANAYKTLYLGAGADATVVGSNFKDTDFTSVQGHGETRIAAAAEVPAIIVGLSEGLESATYSNFGQARRRFADGTMRPLWRNMADSLATVVDVPGGARLWYDDRDIPFLAEDAADAAKVHVEHATAINILVTAGFDPESAVDATVAGDLGRLKHTGLTSVQLLPPGQSAQPQPQLPAPTTNGSNGKRDNEAVLALAGAIAGQKPSTVAIGAPQMHIHEGAIRSEHQIQALPPQSTEVNIPEGAVRVEVPVNVEAAKPADVTIAKDAIRVEAPTTVEAPPPAEVNVAPAQLTIEEGAVQVPVNVEPAEVNVATPEMRIEEGAVKVDVPVKVDAPPPAEVNIAKGAVRVDAPVTVEPTEVRIEEGAIQMEAAQAPNVNVEVDARAGKRTVTFSDGSKAEIEESMSPLGKNDNPESGKLPQPDEEKPPRAEEDEDEQ